MKQTQTNKQTNGIVLGWSDLRKATASNIENPVFYLEEAVAHVHVRRRPKERGRGLRLGPDTQGVNIITSRISAPSHLQPTYFFLFLTRRPEVKILRSPLNGRLITSLDGNGGLFSSDARHDPQSYRKETDQWRRES